MTINMLSTTLTANLRNLTSQIAKINAIVLTSRHVSSNHVGKESLKPFEDEDDPEEARAREALIEKKRNKSGLFVDDFNKQHDRPPYPEPMFEHHETLRYRRRQYGKYGGQTNVNPSILWPNREELSAMKEYEGIAQPFTVRQLIQKVKEKKASEVKEREEAEARILKKVDGIDAEIAAFKKREAVKNQKIEEILAKKNKLIEEVRQHFGYKIDVKDPRFKEMVAELELKQKKEAKAAKKAKQKAKLEAFLSGVKEEKEEEEEEKKDEKQENES